MHRGTLLALTGVAGVQQVLTVNRHSTPLLAGMVRMAQQATRLMGEEGQVCDRPAVWLTPLELISLRGRNSGAEAGHDCCCTCVYVCVLFAC